MQCTEDGAGGAAFGKHLTRRTVLLDCHSHAGWSSLQVPGTRSARVLRSGSLSNLKQLACQILTALHGNGVKCPIRTPVFRTPHQKKLHPWAGQDQSNGRDHLSRPSCCLPCLGNGSQSCTAGKGIGTMLDAQQRPVGTQAARSQDSSPLGPLGKIIIFLSSK